MFYNKCDICHYFVRISEFWCKSLMCCCKLFRCSCIEQSCKISISTFKFVLVYVDIMNYELKSLFFSQVIIFMQWAKLSLPCIESMAGPKQFSSRLLYLLKIQYKTTLVTKDCQWLLGFVLGLKVNSHWEGRSYVFVIFV